jgi:hypothetical protein
VYILEKKSLPPIDKLENITYLIKRNFDMPKALKISDSYFIALDHIKRISTEGPNKTINLTVDYDIPNVGISINEHGEGEYHRIKRELEEFFSITL